MREREMPADRLSHQGTRGSPMRSLKSLEFRLPLMAGVTLLATIAALVAAAYIAVRRTTLLGSSLKFDGRFILQTQTDGPVSLMVVEVPKLKLALAAVVPI